MDGSVSEALVATRWRGCVVRVSEVVWYASRWFSSVLECFAKSVREFVSFLHSVGDV